MDNKPIKRKAGVPSFLTGPSEPLLPHPYPVVVELAAKFNGLHTVKCGCGWTGHTTSIFDGGLEECLAPHYREVRP